MSEKTRRDLLKSALLGGAALAGGTAALVLPAAGQQSFTAVPPSGTPGGPTSSIQYNGGSGTFAGNTNFEFTSAGVVKIGPNQSEIPPGSPSVPRLQLPSSSLVKIATNTIDSMAGIAYVDDSTTASNATNAEDGMVISRNFMPSATVATNFNFNGLSIGLSTDSSNTQDQTGADYGGLNVYAALLSGLPLEISKVLMCSRAPLLARGQHKVSRLSLGSTQRPFLAMEPTWRLTM